jgi:hemerythrin-like domain-containing protein
MGHDTVNTDPIRRFEEEHEVALAAQFAVVREVHGLLCGAVRQHNEDEERALFPALGDEAPLGPFLEEHQTLWQLEERLARALDHREAEEVAHVSLEIVDLLGGHIRRENDVLFPMARTLLGADGLAAVMARLGL